MEDPTNKNMLAKTQKTPLLILFLLFIKNEKIKDPIFPFSPWLILPLLHTLTYIFHSLHLHPSSLFFHSHKPKSNTNPSPIFFFQKIPRNIGLKQEKNSACLQSQSVSNYLNHAWVNNFSFQGERYLQLLGKRRRRASSGSNMRRNKNLNDIDDGSITPLTAPR